MSKENNIKKGLLSEKMSNYSVEPPVEAWKNISSQLRGGTSKRYVFIALAVAAGLALAITVGVNLIDRTPELPLAEKEIDKSASKIDISPKIAQEAVEEPLLQTDKIANQKTEAPLDIITNQKRPSKLEEKVLIAMEEVIEEMESEEGISVEENIKLEQEAEIVAGFEKEQGSETDVQTGTDSVIGLLPAVGSPRFAESENTALDSIASQNYLDSLAAIAQLDEDIIADGSGG